MIWTNHKFPPVGPIPAPGVSAPASSTSLRSSASECITLCGHGSQLHFSANAVHISSASLGDTNPGVNASVQFSSRIHVVEVTLEFSLDAEGISEIPERSMNEAMIECVPNFSEGADRAKVCAIIDAMRVEGVSLLDWSMDSDHNRSVVTIAGPPEAVVQAAVQAAGKAAELIDLTAQQGVHPRIGAADVIPFVPVSGVSLEQCAIFARQAGWEIWNRYGVPIYFYGAAAARPDRAELEDVRRGQFEGLARTGLA